MASGEEQEPCERLAWDSQFFGHAIARVHAGTLTPTRADGIDRWCRANGIALLYFAARGDDAGTPRSAEAAGFHLVDVRMTLEREVPTAPAVLVTPGITPCVESDIPALRAIARGSYADSRFYHDGRIPPQRCDQLFEDWTVAECRGRAARVLVARDGGRPVGYVTLHADRSTGEASIALIAVTEPARGKRVGGALVESAIAWASGEGLGRVDVVTQGRNVRAQRLYQRAGFVTRSVQLYYHKWYD